MYTQAASKTKRHTEINALVKNKPNTRLHTTYIIVLGR